MPNYTPPVTDFAFLLREVFPFDATMAELPGFEEIDAGLALDVLAEGGNFCADVLEPINRAGDETGCRLDNGMVRTPPGMADAYRAFVAAGWCGLSGSPDFGGQGLPRSVQILFDEMVSSANLSFGLFPGLTRGAAEAVAEHADEGLKARYLPGLTDGSATGVMAMTEAGAGSDLGRLITRAEPQADGSHRIHGTKIFISSGDHDFGGNIVHLVLARLPGAAPGTRGISLFLVPKYLPDASGAPGPANALSIGAIEHKMGIHGQPTCVVNYDGAAGWLVGEAGRGLNAMFTMMNAERLFVGIQGLGIAEIATQRATAYARERLQGRGPDGTPAPIAAHPDVRRMLLGGRAFADAGRALAVWTALQMDIAARHPDVERRRDAGALVALLTPVIKAGFTDLGFETAVAAQQVFGGHGYIREWGMEQFVRDARITQLYEGTNGIQALDLVTRKIQADGGAAARAFFGLVRQDLSAAAAVPEVARPMAEALERLESLTDLVGARAGDAAETGALATPYLRVFALTALGWCWLRLSSAAAASTAAAPAFREAKRALARFHVERMLPETLGLEAAIRNGGGAIAGADAALL